MHATPANADWGCTGIQCFGLSIVPNASWCRGAGLRPAEETYRTNKYLRVSLMMEVPVGTVELAYGLDCTHRVSRGFTRNIRQARLLPAGLSRYFWSSWSLIIKQILHPHHFIFRQGRLPACADFLFRFTINNLLPEKPRTDLDLDIIHLVA